MEERRSAEHESVNTQKRARIATIWDVQLGPKSGANPTEAPGERGTRRLGIGGAWSNVLTGAGGVEEVGSRVLDVLTD